MEREATSEYHLLKRRLVRRFRFHLGNVGLDVRIKIVINREGTTKWLTVGTAR